MIVSHINYCILAWGYEYSRIFKLQKKTIRIISISKYNAHSEPLFKQLNLEMDFYLITLKKTRERDTNTDSNGTYFTLKQNNHVHKHNTRHKDKLHISRTNHIFATKCLRHSISQTRNTTPNDILNQIYTHSLHAFVTEINLSCMLHNLK